MQKLSLFNPLDVPHEALRHSAPLKMNVSGCSCTDVKISPNVCVNIAILFFQCRCVLDEEFNHPSIKSVSPPDGPQAAVLENYQPIDLHFCQF